jgi:hypothetical protein
LVLQPGCEQAMSRSTLMVAATLVTGEIRATTSDERQPLPERRLPTVTERRRGWVLLNAVHRSADEGRCCPNSLRHSARKCAGEDETLGNPTELLAVSWSGGGA